jgi:hypothetical protein
MEIPIRYFFFRQERRTQPIERTANSAAAHRQKR